MPLISAPVGSVWDTCRRSDISASRPLGAFCHLRLGILTAVGDGVAKDRQKADLNTRMLGWHIAHDRLQMVGLVHTSATARYSRDNCSPRVQSRM